MNELISIFVLYVTCIYFMFLEQTLTIKNALKVTLICLFLPYGQTSYYMVDEFLTNNAWAFLLLLFFTVIYAASK